MHIVLAELMARCWYALQHFATVLCFTVKKKELKNGVKVLLGLAKAKLDQLINARKDTNSLSNVDFVYANINSKSSFQIIMSLFLTQWVIHF